ncbi:MAG: YdcF family protein [Pirellulaceae bacterium]|nr:YdcF family protein [Pirellulaceae bacterium]
MTLAAESSARTPVRRWVVWPICMLAVASAIAIAAGVTLGRQGAEKALTQLMMPVGLSWLGLTAWVVLGWTMQGISGRWPALIAWLLLTVCGTSPLPNWCLGHLENQVVAYRPGRDAPLDVLIVLGGGTRTGPSRSEISDSGDRVVYAAQLYLQGHTRRLITTGSATASAVPGDLSPTQQTLEIWQALGIPDNAISALPGRNTYEEIQSLRATPELWNGQRVGVLTSAAHLPRALRLAARAGLSDLIPVAASHRGDSRGLSVLSFVPSASNLEKMAACQHEWMGWLVGR